MCAASGFYSQIYLPLLHSGQFPNSAGVYPIPASWEHSSSSMPSRPLHTQHERLTVPFVEQSVMRTEHMVESYNQKIRRFQPTPALLERMGEGWGRGGK